MNAIDCELVADQLVHMARPGGVVLVDSHYFTTVVDILRRRGEHLHLSVRTAHFDDPVHLLKQVLAAPTPEVACCPEGTTGEQCECLRKAHMLLEQLGVPIIETHEELIPSHGEPPMTLGSRSRRPGSRQAAA